MTMATVISPKTPPLATPEAVAPLARAFDPLRFGGKAAPLAKAIAAGFVVPEGFVVAADLSAGERGALAGAIRDQLAELAGDRFAVRSSAVGEDGRERSFAGQLETVLSVHRDDVLAAVERCAGSASALRALRYGGARLGGVGVIVQRMVSPKSAGVAFSADPQRGERGTCHIEAVPGLGEGLVSGASDPEAWRVTAHAAERARALEAPVLSTEEVRRVAELARAMETLFGAPQDVEWAFADDTLYLLQSRPITALPAAPVPIAVEIPAGGWDRDDHHGVLSPLGWAWFQPYPKAMAEGMREAGVPIERIEVTRIGGHLYQRMVMGGGDSAKLPPRWVLWLATRLVPSLRRANRAASALCDEEGFVEQLEAWERGGRDAMLRAVDDVFVAEPERLSDDALLEHIERALAVTARGLENHAAIGGPSMFGVGKLFLFLEDELGWDGHVVFELMAGSSVATTALHRQLEEIITRHRGELEAAGGTLPSWSALLGRCPALGRELVAWLGDNRLRMLHYDPKHPMLGERPDYVLSIVEGIAANLRAAQPRTPQAENEERLAEARARLSPERYDELERLLALARRCYALRDDNGVVAVSRPAGLLRHFVLELGRRLEPALGAREHAVYLYPEEHRSALRGELEELSELVERRRGEESWALFHRGPKHHGPPAPPMPPPSVFPGPMSRLMRIFAWMESAERTPEPSEGDVLHGVGIGTEVVTGRARVIHRIEEMAKLQHGEIVVCRITSPECAVALGRVAAIVTNEGGALSHPAIIAREFGVSAVVGAADATHRIHTGDRLSVDPVAGTVTLLPRVATAAPRGDV